MRLERVPRRSGEDLARGSVGQLGVCDCELAEQLGGGSDVGEPRVGFRVDAGYEEAGDGGHAGRVAAAAEPAVEAASVGLGDGTVTVEAEEERDVDRNTMSDGVLDRGDARDGGGDLDVEVRAINEGAQP